MEEEEEKEEVEVEEEVLIEEVIEKHQLPNKAPRINWGQDFEDRPPEERVAYMKKFCNSFNTALDMMQKERNNWLKKSNHFELQVIHFQDVINRQREFIQDSVRKENETKKIYQEKIDILAAKLKELM
jgi:hypothetical protein